MKRVRPTCIRLYEIARYSDLTATRTMLAIAELLWAITLFMPGNTFDRPTYKILSNIAPETAWAFAFLLMGLVQSYILLRAEYHDRLAVWFAATNMSFWTFVCIAMILSVSPFPAAISGEIALAFGSSWVFVRSGKKMGRRHGDG